jgi:hypothetical protein
MAYVAVSASPIRVREVSGPVDPGYGVGSEHPDQGLPGGGLYPDQGLPIPPPGIWPPPTVSHPIVPIPPGSEVPPGTIWPPPGGPLYPSHGLPGEPPRPDNTLPGQPPRPDNTLPGQPGHPDNALPSQKFWIVAGIPGYGWRYVCVDPSLRPDQGLPPQPPGPQPKS